MEQFLINILPSLGIGGTLAAFMFYFYRLDSKEWMNRYEALARDFKTVIQDNTKALTILAERTEFHISRNSENKSKSS